MSLKLDIQEYPEAWSQQLVSAVENYKNGERNSKRKLYKFVNREISEHYYHVLIERYQNDYRYNKRQRENEQSKKIKNGFLDVLALVIMLVSLLCGIVYFVSEYDKNVAVWYFFFFLFAFDRIIKSNDQVVSSLEIENRLLKSRNETLEAIIKEYKKEEN